MTMTHDDVGSDAARVSDAVRSFFGAHAEDYRHSPRHRAGADLSLLVNGLHPVAGEAALDLATGPGHVALAMARHGLNVTGLDLTAEMLTVATASANEAGLGVAWVSGDAAALPFGDASFDIVTCRRAAHHFPSPAKAVREAWRVLRPGGRFGLSDLTAPASAIDALNHVERVRDRSHQRALAPDEWVDTVLAAGFDLTASTLYVEVLTKKEWLSPVAWESPQGVLARNAMDAWGDDLAAALGRGDAFRKYRLVLWAEKAR